MDLTGHFKRHRDVGTKLNLGLPKQLPDCTILPEIRAATPPSDNLEDSTTDTAAKDAENNSMSTTAKSNSLKAQIKLRKGPKLPHEPVFAWPAAVSSQAYVTKTNAHSLLQEYLVRSQSEPELHDDSVLSRDGIDFGKWGTIGGELMDILRLVQDCISENRPSGKEMLARYEAIEAWDQKNQESAKKEEMEYAEMLKDPDTYFVDQMVPSTTDPSVMVPRGWKPNATIDPSHTNSQSTTRTESSNLKPPSSITPLEFLETGHSLKVELG